MIEKNNKNILLISGTADIGTYKGMDLKNTIYDDTCRDELIKKYYTINGKTVIPENAIYTSKMSVKKSLLRYNRQKYPPLVTKTLESILSSHEFLYESIECNRIWKEKDYCCKQEFTIVCLSTTFMWSEEMIEKAISWINRNVNYQYLILGGHYSSVKYKYILENYDEVDFIIVGDGETALPQLIQYLLYCQGELYKICNLAYMENGNIHQTKMMYEDLNKIERVKYDGQYKWLSYESVRGCAYGCAFCTWDAGIKKFRYKSPEKVLSDFTEYKNENGIERIEINDSTFLFPFERIEPIVDGITRIGLHWKAHARSDVPYTEELVKKLEKSNCDILQIGFESMTDRVLNNMNKKTTAAQNRHTNLMFKNSKIDTVVSFIVGFPDETVAEFNTTREYIINELVGHFYIFVFEMEDKSLKLWQERDKYGFVLYDDEKDCVHGGANWKHNGMDSRTAFSLRADLLREVRRKMSNAIYKSWQSPYDWPFIPEFDKEMNLEIERLLDNLVFATVDCSPDKVCEYIRGIVDELERYGVSFDE